ncbi:MAG: cation:proton antiporter family protein [Candidatus Pacearchaeota archaeon]
MAIESSFLNLTQTQSILITISLIIIVSAILSYISYLLRQNLIIAYILTGIILGPLVFGLIKDKILINGLAEIGITFLLFIAGLEFSIKKLKEIAKTSIITGLIQVIGVSILTFFVLFLFGFNKIEAILLGFIISFSSTVVVIKILSDKNELDSLQGKIVVGIMLVQDIIALIILGILSKNISSIFINFVKLIFISLFALFINIITKPIIKKSSSSSELLFVISLAFLFLFVSITYFLELSIGIGAFLAGIILANTPYKIDIATKIKYLRDFFSIIFFVFIGLWLTNISKNILILTIPIFFILLFFEPILTAIILRFNGYKINSSLDIGFSFAQISEFSLIIILYSLNLGIVSQKSFELIILIAVISIALTPYTMKLSKLFYKPFKIFDELKIPFVEDIGYLTKGKKTVLIIGCHRMGSIYVKELEKIKDRLIVIDFNPDIIKALERKNISAVYGDVSNIEIFEKPQLKNQLLNLRVVISTIPIKEINEKIIEYFKKLNKNIFIAVTSNRIDDSLELYDKGADFVIMPLVMSAMHSIDMIKKLTKKQFKKLKKEQIEILKEIHKILY